MLIAQSNIFKGLKQIYVEMVTVVLHISSNSRLLYFKQIQCSLQASTVKFK